MEIVYVGPHDGVEIPAAGNIIANRDEPVEVPNDIARSLLERDDFEKATKGARR